MKKILTILLLTTVSFASANTSFVDKVNQRDWDYRNKIVYILSDVISQIKKDDILFWPFEVTRIIDWDTYEIDYFWEKEKIRLYWVDTPEKWEVWFTEATDYAISLLLNEEIYLKRIDSDRWSFWRLLREVYIDDINFWELLLKNWYAGIY